MQPTWIHLAGIAGNLKLRQPPFWRYRLGPTGEERHVNSWEITGDCNSSNNTHGSDPDASFRVWFALYGMVAEETQPGTNYPDAYFTLATPSNQALTTTQSGFSGGERAHAAAIRIYAAADLVNKRSPFCWRCEYTGKTTELRSFTLHGQAHTANFSPGSELLQDPPRLWLAVRGQIRIDDEKNATVLLE